MRLMEHRIRENYQILVNAAHFSNFVSLIRWNSYVNNSNGLQFVVFL